jgi:hypothetical protein
MSLEFVTHDVGYTAQVAQTQDFLGSGVYAVLVDTAHTPDRATDDAYSDISANECGDTDYSAQALASKTIALASTSVRLSCGKITFTASGDVSGRYVYILFGTAATPQSTDVILGHVDLTGSGNASSVGAEFSYTPSASGLLELPRSVAA